MVGVLSSFILKLAKQRKQWHPQNRLAVIEKRDAHLSSCSTSQLSRHLFDIVACRPPSQFVWHLLEGSRAQGSLRRSHACFHSFDLEFACLDEGRYIEVSIPIQCLFRGLGQDGPGVNLLRTFGVATVIRSFGEVWGLLPLLSSSSGQTWIWHAGQSDSLGVDIGMSCKLKEVPDTNIQNLRKLSETRVRIRLGPVKITRQLCKDNFVISQHHNISNVISPSTINPTLHGSNRSTKSESRPISTEHPGSSKNCSSLNAEKRMA